MSLAYIKVNSVTHAMRIKNVLIANGIYAQVLRNVNSNPRKGCGYSVSVNGDLKRVEEALRRNNVRFLGFTEAREK